MKFGQAAVKLLENYQVDTVFGIPGVHTIELYRGLEESGIRSVPARHEQGSAFMADGYARVSGKPGVCLLITGPGVLNALTPMAQAWHDSVPMLVLASSTDSRLAGRNRGPLHDIPDQAALVGQLTSPSVTVSSPEEYAQVLAEVWHGFTHGRPRPAHISIPIDLLEKEVGEISAVDLAAPGKGWTDEQIKDAAELLQSAHRPVIIAGGGALGARAEVTALAERFDAPVAATCNAKALMDPDHPLAAWNELPFSGTREEIAAADVVLAIGTEFSETEIIYTGQPLRLTGRIIRIDVDPAQLDVPFASTVGIAGKAVPVLEALLAATAGTSALTGNATTGTGADRAARMRSQIQWSSASRLHMPWLDALHEATPKDSITVLDSTQLAYTAQHYLPSTENWIATYGMGTLGAAVPMAVGARIAAPERPVLAIAGDGGSLFTLPEMASAVDHRSQLTVVIWDNAGYGEIRDSFDRASARRVDTEVTAVDHVRIAEGFGARAERVDDPLAFGQALKRSYQHDGVTVIVATAPDHPAAISRAY